MPRTFQSKGFVCKTVDPDVLSFARSFCESCPGSRWAYALHIPAPPKVEHWHFVGLFEDRVFWRSVYDYAMKHDPCSSTDNAKKPRKAVRYLLHLDSPDKHSVDRSSLVSGGCWGPDELEDWLSVSSLACNLVDRCLALCASGHTPLDAFSVLCSEGFEPFQISSALQAFSRLQMFWEQTRYRGMGALRRPHQGGTCSPPSNREGQSPDYQGKKSNTQTQEHEKDYLHARQKIKQETPLTAEPPSQGFSRGNGVSCEDFPVAGNLSVRVPVSECADFTPPDRRGIDPPPFTLQNA